MPLVYTTHAAEVRVAGIYMRPIDPTAHDDETQGYRVFDEWQNSESLTFFKCARATPGEALWYPWAWAAPAPPVERQMVRRPGR